MARRTLARWYVTAVWTNSMLPGFFSVTPHSIAKNTAGGLTEEGC